MLHVGKVIEGIPAAPDFAHGKLVIVKTLQFEISV